MTRLVMILVLIATAFVSAPVDAQTSTPALTGDQIVDRVAPSVALILVGSEAGELTGVASAVVVRPDGVLLTAYHGLKQARQVQVRLKSGEIYDQVQQIGVDARRDVAALRIAAANLPAVTAASSAESKPGAPVFVLSNGAALPWTVSSGVLSSLRMADEVPGAGSGYRLLQFTAPISPGSSGGVLVDAQGRALGIIVATLEGGQNVNFAVPVDAVLGLAGLPGGTAFASGASLKLPNLPAAPQPANKPEPTPEVVAAAPAQPPADRLQAPDTVNSQPLESRDPQTILRNFRTVYIDSKTMWLKANVMKSAIYKKKEFMGWGITVVDQLNLADVVLRIQLISGTEDYTYELQHLNTSITLDSGKVRAFQPILWMSGNTAAPMIADALLKTIRATGRGPASPEAPKPAPKKEKN